MISWIQTYFQKHIRLVMFVMLLLIGLPMVFIYSQSSGFGHGDSRVREQKFFNVNLANPEQAQRIVRDGELSARLRFDYGGLQNIQAYALQRVAGLALADQLHLPESTAEQVSKYTGTLPAFLNEQGQFDQTAYTRFGDSVKAAGSPYTIADVNRVLHDDARLVELAKVVGGPGYVLPSDVKRQLSLMDSVWTIDVAELDYAGFTPAINPTDEALKKFHDENTFRYAVPARPRLSLVEFKLTNYAPPSAPNEAELRAFYDANRERFPAPADAEKKDAAALATPAAPADDFPKVRAQVEASLRDLAARRLASQAANDLTVALFERKAALKPNSPELAAYLNSLRLSATPVAPFAPNFPPADRAWLASYATQISQLNADRPVSDALPTPDGFVVMLWNEDLPASQPLYVEVRDRVLADYKENEKRRLFIERGNALKAKLQAAGSGFTAAAEAEKIPVKRYAGFKLSQPPQDIPQPAFEPLLTLAAGQVSDLVASGDKALLVHVQEKKEPDLTSANPRYAEVQANLMTRASAARETSYLAQLVEEEHKKNEPEAVR